MSTASCRRVAFQSFYITIIAKNHNVLLFLEKLRIYDRNLQFFSNNGLLLRCDAICQHTISSMIIIATTALLIRHCRYSKK